MKPARLLSPATLGLLLPAAPAGWPKLPNWLEGDLLLVWDDLSLYARFLWRVSLPGPAVLTSSVLTTHELPSLRPSTAPHCGTLLFSARP